MAMQVKQTSSPGQFTTLWQRLKGEGCVNYIFRQIFQAALILIRCKSGFVQS